MSAPAPPPDAGPLQARKRLLRRRVLRARSGLPPQVRRRFADGVADAVTGWEPVAGLAAGSTVAAYVGVGTEVGTDTLLEALRGRGVRVLLPRWRGGNAMSWAVFAGQDALTDAPRHAGRHPVRLREPTGPDLPPSTLREAAAVVLPALAVDRAGTRLGRGAGAYDAALALHVDPAVPTCALLYPGELLDEPLPSEPHDRRVSAVAQPTGVTDLATPQT